VSEIVSESRLLPPGDVKLFVASLRRFKFGITVIITGKTPAVSASCLAPKEVYFEFDMQKQLHKRSWSERRFGKWLELRSGL